MSGLIEQRLKELEIELPEPTRPKVAKILPTMIVDRLLFVSGMTPQWNGELRFIGKLGKEFSLEEGQAAARLCTLNILAQARVALDGDLDRIQRVVNVKGYVNAMPDFTNIPGVVNGASELLIDIFGDAGFHTRTAMGNVVMPFDVALEVEAIFELR
ncbi:MAG: RidA family protein [Alphaproteobacteria bacterium]|mgnify:CR=1 FL=1|nr:RidA family protein [Alphaproteobacteria bacterium]